MEMMKLNKMGLDTKQQGRKSCFYYAGWVFLEKLRIWEGRERGSEERGDERRLRRKGFKGWREWRGRKRVWRRRYPA